MLQLFFMMLVGLTLMIIGFKGYHVSYLSILEVLQGERSVSHLFAARASEPVKRIQYDIADKKSYYVRVRYHDSLQVIWHFVLAQQSMAETTQLLRSLPPLTAKEFQYYQTLSYSRETSESSEITKYLNYLPKGRLAPQFNLLERAVFAAIKKINKQQLVQLIKDAELLLNFSESRVQAEFAIFEYDANDVLTAIVSR